MFLSLMLYIYFLSFVLFVFPNINKYLIYIWIKLRNSLNMDRYIILPITFIIWLKIKHILQA